MPTIDDGRQINVDEISLLQTIVTGNPVTDHFVDARAATLGESLVTQGCRHVPVIARVLFHVRVDFTRGDPRNHKISYEIE